MQTAKRLTLPVILFAVSLLLYSPVRNHAFVNYDDPDYVTANPHVRSGLTGANVRWAFTSAYGANWIPLTWISHMLDVELFGLDPGRHHLTSVVLHALSAVLLYLALLRLTDDRWRAVFVAAVFAWHPLHVESVAWIAERKDVLCGLFWMAGLLAYARYVARPSAAAYALVAGCLAAALLSKPMAVTFPAVLLLLDWWPLKRRPNVLEKLPLFAMSAAAALVTFFAQRGGGAVLTVDDLPLTARAANALVSYAVYAWKFVWPAGLAVFYPFRTPAAWEVAVAVAALAGITWVAARRREWLAGWLWFLVTLLPVIGLVQVGLQARADRYTYLPSIGLAIVLAWAVPTRKPFALAGAAACLACAAVTWSTLSAWRDSGTLFERALTVTERNYVAHNNLGVFLRGKGEFDAAVRHFSAAIEIRPAYADARNNLGEMLLLSGRDGEAEAHIRAALALHPSSPEAHVNLGTVFTRRGDSAAANAEYRRALELDPDNPEAHVGLGGLDHLQQAIRIRPDYADAWYNLGRLHGLENRPADAAAAFQQVIRLRPSDPEGHYNLGTAYVALDRLGDAIDEFRAAIQLQPNYVNAHYNLGAAYATRGDCAAAIPEFTEVLRLQPTLEEARRNLAYCQGRP